MRIRTSACGSKARRAWPLHYRTKTRRTATGLLVIPALNDCPAQSEWSSFLWRLNAADQWFKTTIAITITAYVGLSTFWIAVYVVGVPRMYAGSVHFGSTARMSEALAPKEVIGE